MKDVAALTACEDDKRNYATAPPAVRDLYRSAREKQTRQVAAGLQEKYHPKNNVKMRSTMWDALQKLGGIHDCSDPDLEGLTNDIHALQTAYAAELAGQPDEMIVTCLIHDLGKVLFLWGCDEDGNSLDQQWAMVGDTFVCGHPVPPTMPFPEYNDLHRIDEQDGPYAPHVGMENVTMSYGHDQYLFDVLLHNQAKHSLPLEYLNVIRFHSCYSWHSFGQYTELESESDKVLKPRVKEFQGFDLYSKDEINTAPVSFDHFRPLIEKFFGSELLEW